LQGEACVGPVGVAGLCRFGPGQDEEAEAADAAEVDVEGDGWLACPGGWAFEDDLFVGDDDEAAAAGGVGGVVHADAGDEAEGLGVELEGHDGGGGEADAVGEGLSGDAEGVAALVAAGDDGGDAFREGLDVEGVEPEGVGLLRMGGCGEEEVGEEAGGNG